MRVAQMATPIACSLDSVHVFRPDRRTNCADLPRDACNTDAVPQLTLALHFADCEFCFAIALDGFAAAAVNVVVAD